MASRQQGQGNEGTGATVQTFAIRGMPYIHKVMQAAERPVHRNLIHKHREYVPSTHAAIRGGEALREILSSVNIGLALFIIKKHAYKVSHSRNVLGMIV